MTFACSYASHDEAQVGPVACTYIHSYLHFFYLKSKHIGRICAHSRTADIHSPDGTQHSWGVIFTNSSGAPKPRVDLVTRLSRPPEVELGLHCPFFALHAVMCSGTKPLNLFHRLAARETCRYTIRQEM